MSYDSRNHGWVRAWLFAGLLGAASVAPVDAFVGIKVTNPSGNTIRLRGTGGDYSESTTAFQTAGGASTSADWANQARAAGYGYTFLVECFDGASWNTVGSLAVTLCTYSGGYSCNHNSSCSAPGGTVSTNYSKSFCITNKLGTYSYPNVTMHTAAGSTPLTESLDSLAPGAYRCFTVTNDVPFTITYGDTLFTADVPETTLYPSTNVTVNSPPPSTTTTGPSGGPVVANPGSTNPSSGTNAVGGSSSLTQLDLNRAADAIIHSQAQNTARIVAGLEDVRDAINSNTNGPGDTFDDAASLMSNVVNAAASSSVTASNSAAGAVSTASNNLSSISSGLYGLGGTSITGSVATLAGQLTGTAPPAGYGVIVVTGGVAVANRTIDLGSAINGAALDAYMGGSAWRSWLRFFLAWGLVISLVVWFSGELQTSMAQIAAASQLQVGSDAAGAFSLVPGTNIGLRAILVVVGLSAIAFLPSLIVVLYTSTHYVATGDSPATGLGYLASGGSVPSAVYLAFHRLNELLPLVEGVVMGINTAAARLVIAPATSFLCLLMKAIGV